MSWRRLLGLVIGLGLATASGVAEEGGSRGHERRAEAFRMVDAYVIANIQESLGLTDAQYEKVVPLVNKLQKARREYFRERSQGLRRLRQLLSSGAGTEAEVVEALEAFKALETGGPAAAREQMAALDAVLSPLQQAKFRVFEVEVEQRMRRLMRRGRSEGPKPDETQ